MLWAVEGRSDTSGRQFVRDFFRQGWWCGVPMGRDSMENAQKGCLVWLRTEARASGVWTRK
jgi:hypothetical protein